MGDINPESINPTLPKEGVSASTTRYRFDLTTEKLVRQEIPQDPKLNIVEKEAHPAEYEVALRQMQEKAKRIEDAIKEPQK